MRKHFLLNLTGLFVFFLFTCMFISCGKSGKSKSESEESSKSKSGGFFEWLVPSASARDKDARIKCVNNLNSIGKATIGFAVDNGARTPWNLIPSQQRNHFGSNYNLTVGSIFGLAAMKSELQTSKILISPCDKGRIAANELLERDWRNYNTKGGNPIPHGGLSYGLCFGGDFQRPATVVAMTRNLSTDDLATAVWVGAEDAKRGMAGLQVGQGQVLRADGSASVSTSADLSANGKIIKSHIASRGGTSPLGASRTGVILPY